MTGLESWKEKDLTVQNVKLKLIDEWERRYENVRKGSDVFCINRTEIDPKKHIKCHQCKREGHIKRNCPMLKNETVKITNFSGGRRNCYDPKDSQWCIDSGASSHMTYSKSFFLNFDESFRGT